MTVNNKPYEESREYRVEVSFDGWVHINAKSEDEARELVRNMSDAELYENTNGEWGIYDAEVAD